MIRWRLGVENRFRDDVLMTTAAYVAFENPSPRTTQRLLRVEALTLAHLSPIGTRVHGVTLKVYRTMLWTLGALIADSAIEGVVAFHVVSIPMQPFNSGPAAQMVGPGVAWNNAIGSASTAGFGPFGLMDGSSPSFHIDAVTDLSLVHVLLAAD